MKQTNKKLLKNQSDLNDNEKDELRISKNILISVIKNRESLEKRLNEKQRISSSTTSSSTTSSSTTSSSITEIVPYEKQKISSSTKESVPNEYEGLRTFLQEYKTILDNRNRKKNKTGVPSEDTSYKLQEVQSLIREMIKEKIN